MISRYVKRLTEEWLAHNKLIVAVDYDDTLYPWKFATQEECDKVFNLLEFARMAGIYVVIFTASGPERYEEITKYCNSKGLKIDSINKNPIDLPYGHEENAKIYYNIFLCDRAGLDASMEVLHKAAGNVITEKRNKYDQTLNDVA